MNTQKVITALIGIILLCGLYIFISQGYKADKIMVEACAYEKIDCESLDDRQLRHAGILRSKLK